jgi:hypothetical protein
LGASGGAGGGGGRGVLLMAGGTVLNLGAIEGGAGGQGGEGTFGGATGANGEAGGGVVLHAGGAVVNGSSTVSMALISGDYGVFAEAGGPATVTNFGTIAGTSGVSVGFKSANDRLIVEAGSTFVGRAQGGGGTLELANGSGTISGLGSGLATLSGAVALQASAFDHIEVDAAAHWSLTGVNQLNAGQSLISAGSLAVGGNIRNAGTISAKAGGQVEIASAIANTGVLVAAAGTLTLDKAVTGAGSGRIYAGGTLFAKAGFSENVAIFGAAGMLELARSQAYAGKVTGLTGRARLDLRDIDFVSASEATFAGTKAGGTLTVSDGSHTAKIKLAGDYTGMTFTAARDGHGGTRVSIQAPPAVHGLVAAIAAAPPEGGLAPPASRMVFSETPGLASLHPGGRWT